MPKASELMKPLVDKANEIPDDQLVEAATMAHRLRETDNTSEHRMVFAAVLEVIELRFGGEFADRLMDELDERAAA